MLFECSAFDAIRAARSSLFADAIGQDVHAFMAQPDQGGVFWFVCDCLRVVRHELEHPGQSPSIDVVDLGISDPIDRYE